MSVATVRLEVGTERPRPTWSANLSLQLLVLTFLMVWVPTRAHFMADTNVYAEAILHHQRGGGTIDYKLLTSNPFWDFGHLLWRPFGWLCFVIARPLTRMFEAHSERGQVIVTLIGINFVAALACLCFFSLLARRTVGNIWPAALATLGLLSSDAFLNYAHSGTAYVPGLACLVAGVCVSLGRDSQAASLGATLVSALMFALSVLFWFPYVFVLPAAMAARLLIDGTGRQHWRAAVQTAVACAVIGTAVYTSSIAALGISHFADLKGWILASGHGQIQAGGLRAVARLAFSVPRSFVNMDQDGMWLKRYLVHDPYAPVTVATLFRLSLWKLVLFYVSAAVICMELLRSKQGRMLFLLLLFAAVPVFVFALFVFEAGSIERYLPLYPFIFLALAFVLGAEQTRFAAKVLLVLALMIMTAINVNSMRNGTLESRKAGVLARISDLIPLLDQNSLVLAVNEQDDVAEFRLNSPLDPINLRANWQLYDMLEINTARLLTWREDFATRTLATWQRGGEIWLPERVFRSQPRPEWNWVEGDDKRVKWTDLPSFFSQFEVGSAIGGEDGFVLLKASSKNKEILAHQFTRNPGEGL
jgi:hypothetical protein